ncbi:MAG: hypothetical protein WCI41_02110 [bacterium]
MKDSKDELVKLTEEEQEAVDRDWKIFCDTVNADAPQGQNFYMPKEVNETLRRTYASGALLRLAREYVMETNDDLQISEQEKNLLLKKAETTAKHAVMIDPYPLTFYEAGNIFYKINEVEQARIFYMNFLKSASGVLSKESSKNLITCIEMAIKDIESKNIL